MTDKGYVKSRDIRAGAMCVLAAYAAFGFIFSDFGISAVYGAGLLCLWALACGAAFLRRKAWKDIRFSLTDGAWLLFVLTVFVNILRIFDPSNRTVIYYFLILGASSVVFWTRRGTGEKEISAAKWILLGVACLFAGVNVLYQIFPEPVKKVLSAIQTDTSTAYVLSHLRRGYGIPFGEDVGFTASLLSVGAAIACLELTEKNWKTRAPLAFFLVYGLFAMQRRGEAFVWVIAMVILHVFMLVQARRNAFGLDRKTATKRTLLRFACAVLAVVLLTAVVGTGRFGATAKLLHPEEAQEQTAETTPAQTPTEATIPAQSPTEATTPVQVPTEEAAEPTAAQTVPTTPPVQEQPATEEAQTSDTADRLAAYANGRMPLWRAAWNCFLDSPVFGNGWGSYTPAVKDAGLGYATNAHNIYLQVLCETGIVGFVLIGAAFLTILVGIIRKLLTAGSLTEYQNTMLAAYLVLALLGIGVMDNPLYRVYWMIFVIMAMMITDPRQCTGQRE